MVEIRNFESGDANGVLSLLRVCFDHRELEGITSLDLLDWYRQFPGGMKVAAAGGQIIGFVFAFTSRGIGWVTLLCVKPELRRQRIGSRLLEAALEYLSAKEARTVKLDVEPENPAVKLYRKFGFDVERTLLRLRKVLG